jgi:cation diffusion facilitator family transporter
VASSRKSLLAAAAANVGVAITKFVVGGLTGSTVMLAEGVHSLVDTGNSGLMLLGTRLSRRPADDSHPFGYGMELYFWSLVVAMVVFGGGGGLSAYQGVRALMEPRAISHLWPNYVVIVAAAVFESSSLVVGIRQLRLHEREHQFRGSLFQVMQTSKNPAIFLAVLEDTAALIGLGVAALGLTLARLLAVPEIDGIATIVIGLVLFIEALILGRECRSLIVGETARKPLVARIRGIVEGHQLLGARGKLRTLQLGAETILVFLRLQPPATMTAAELARQVAALEAEVARAVPSVRHVYIALEPGEASG